MITAKNIITERLIEKAGRREPQSSESLGYVGPNFGSAIGGLHDELEAIKVSYTSFSHIVKRY